jgi:hypothetical protein
LVLAWALPLVRPEGMLFSGLVATTLLLYPRVPTVRERARGLWALAVPAAIPLFLLLATGTARSSTMIVKLLPGNPYYAGSTLYSAVANNVRVLTGTLLNGELWSLEFLPSGGAPVALGGLVAILALGVQRRRRWRAGIIVLSALVMFVPCTYDTFLWNRLRYLWPFATGWLVGAACAAEVAGDILASVRARWKLATPIACGAVVGALAVRLGGTLDDVADSASGIDRQQVELGRWVKRELATTAGARIGVNDTGAIAYFGERPTFDIVGLTTPNEARYWVAGPGSRLEHYERMLRAAPEELPTHFVVYPEWMACSAVLGEALREAVVTDSTILGGHTMRAYVADYSRLGSGEAPWTDDAGELVDALDVADLESEAEHGYELLGAGVGEQIAKTGEAPDGRVVVDGGRARRRAERFTLGARSAPSGARLALVARLEAPAPTRISVKMGDTGPTTIDVPADGWSEVELEVPGGVSGRFPVQIATSAPITTFHYWLVRVPRSPK